MYQIYTGKYCVNWYGGSTSPRYGFSALWVWFLNYDLPFLGPTSHHHLLPFPIFYNAAMTATTSMLQLSSQKWELLSGLAETVEPICKGTKEPRNTVPRSMLLSHTVSVNLSFLVKTYFWQLGTVTWGKMELVFHTLYSRSFIYKNN